MHVGVTSVPHPNAKYFVLNVQVVYFTCFVIPLLLTVHKQVHV